MLRYADGDMAAFEQLYARYKGPMYRYLLSKCQNASIADELFQEVWMKLITARVSYSASARFAAYFFKLARHHFIDHYRKQQVRLHLGATTENAELSNLQEKATPEQLAMVDETIDDFQRALQTLPDEQREVFLLREETGMNLQEIADTTGVDYETVKSRLRYAVRKLQNVVNT